MRIAWNKGLKNIYSKETLEKMAKAKLGHKPWNKGEKYPAPWLDKYRFGTRSKPIHRRSDEYTEEERKSIWGNARRGSTLTIEHRLAISKANKGKKFSLGRKASLETKLKMSESQKRIMTPEHIKNCLRRNPKSSLEIKCENILNKFNLPYKFVGNGDFIIGKKNPDFINTNGQKIAIEVFYRRHKEEFSGGLVKWMKDRKFIFREYGWDVVYLDETQVNEEYIGTIKGIKI